MKQLKNGPDFKALIQPIVTEVNDQIDVHAVTHRDGTTDVDIHSPDVKQPVEQWNTWAERIEHSLGDQLEVIGGTDFRRLSDPTWVLIANLKVRPLDHIKHEYRKLYVALRKQALADSIAMWQAARFGYGT